MARKPNGRPYSPELAQEICTAVSEGLTLNDVCKQAGMPSSQTIWRWRQDHPEFAEAYEAARDLQAEMVDHQIVECIRDTTPENYNSMRVKIYGLTWRAERLAPARYGRKDGAIVSGTIVLKATKEDEALK